MRQGNIHFLPEGNITLEKMGRDANPIFRADTMALPCWPLWRRLRERSNEGALSSTGSAWVCCVVYTSSVPFQAHHAKKHMKITQYRHHKGLQKFQEGPRWKKKQETLFCDWVHYCLGRCARFGQGRGIQC